MVLRNNVNYQININLKNEIISIKNLIYNNLTNSEVYLFGSIAKGRYSVNSDIDILILIEDEKSLKELRKIRHFIEDEIGLLNLSREVDIKIYTKSRFLDISLKPSFENEILNDLIDLRSW